MSDWMRFDDLIASEAVCDLAEKRFGDQSGPTEMDRFSAMTALCAVAEPEFQLFEEPHGWAHLGVVVFYAPAEYPSDGWEPWVCTIYCGASTQFKMKRVEDLSRRYSFDDEIEIRWDVRLFLEGTLWRPINDGKRFFTMLE